MIWTDGDEFLDRKRLKKTNKKTKLGISMSFSLQKQSNKQSNGLVDIGYSRS